MYARTQYRLRPPRFLSVLWVATILFLSMPATTAAYPAILVTDRPDEEHQESARLALLRHGDLTVVTVQMHFSGKAEKLGIIIPIPKAVQASETELLSRQVLSALDHFSSPVLHETWQSSNPSVWDSPPTYHEAPPWFSTAARVARSPDIYGLRRVEGAKKLTKWLADNQLGIRAEALKELASREDDFWFLTGVLHFSADQNALQSTVLLPLRYMIRSETLSVRMWPSGLNDARRRPMTTFLISTQSLKIRDRKHVGLQSADVPRRWTIDFGNQLTRRKTALAQNGMRAVVEFSNIGGCSLHGARARSHAPPTVILSLGGDQITREHIFVADFSSQESTRVVTKTRDRAIGRCTSPADELPDRTPTLHAPGRSVLTEEPPKLSTSVRLVVDPWGKAAAIPDDDTRESQCIADAFNRYPPTLNAKTGDVFEVDARYRPAILGIGAPPVCNSAVSRIFTLETNAAGRIEFESIAASSDHEKPLAWPGKVVFHHAHPKKKQRHTLRVSWPQSIWTLFPSQEVVETPPSGF